MRAVSIDHSHPSRSQRGAYTAPSPGGGVLIDWIESLRPSERIRLFDRLIRADVALASALADFARTPRVARVVFLLMNECAIARGLNVGELAMLCPTIERDAERALRSLTRTAHEPTRAGSASEHRPAIR